jgi:hypothetical protein
MTSIRGRKDHPLTPSRVKNNNKILVCVCVCVCVCTLTDYELKIHYTGVWVLRFPLTGHKPETPKPTADSFV